MSELEPYQPDTQPPGIAGLAPRYRELGRLRLGERVDTGRHKNGQPVKRPAKLETWRFTSTDWRLIARAAELYGGQPETWAEAPGWNPEKGTGVRQFQVTSDANDLPVMLPPDVAISQSMEAWTAGKCLRRCDGQWDQISGAECLCSGEESPACKPTTRLSVLLTDMPGLGVWRVETHGWYAARELVPMVRLAQRYGAATTFRLRIDPRQRQTTDAAGKTVTYLFGVPVLDTDLTPGQLLTAQTSRGVASSYPGSATALDSTSDPAAHTPPGAGSDSTSPPDHPGKVAGGDPVAGEGGGDAGGTGKGAPSPADKRGG